MRSFLNGSKAEGDQEHGSVAEKGSLTKNPVFDGDKPLVTANTTTFNRKATGMALRKWVKYDRSGETIMVQADKYELTHQLGVQLRDLRLLDPQLAMSYPSAILCREKALVVNLEHIKCIITTEHVLVLNADDENVIAFIEELQRRLTPAASDGSAVPKVNSAGEFAPEGAVQGPMRSGVEETPFELRALEVALDMVCTYLEKLTADLEASAHPALDALTAQVTTQNLEWVRRTKSRMVRLTTRVETIRELLEKFLDDDEDMHDMNLTARQQDLMEKQETMIRNSLARSSLQGGKEDPGTARTYAKSDSSSDSEEEEEEIAAVEMILETYFMHLDNTYNKLQTLCEYIDDTQDYINTDLDNHRNQLIRLELLISAATFCITIVGVIAGIFGMNLDNGKEQSYAIFCWVAGSSSVGAVAIFVAIVMYCRWKKLLT